jgi:GPH family glycoside/pentoside/hexuronide:cation symporter
MDSKNEKISFNEKVAYGIGDTASNLFFQTFMFFLPYFYTDVFGLSAVAMSTMFAVVRMIDMFVDPLAGVIADRTTTKWGKFRPYMLWFAIPFGVLGWLTFCTPDISDSGKILYAYLTYGTMMVVYSLANIPYSALLGVITSDPHQRTAISSTRFVCAFIGGFIVQGLTVYMVNKFGHGNNRLGYNLVAALYGITATLMWLYAFYGTKERVAPPAKQKTSLGVDLLDLARNKPWIVLFFIGIFTLSFVSIRNGAIMYYFKYYAAVKTFEFMGMQVDLASTFMLAGTLAAIGSIMLTTTISRFFGKINTYIICMSSTALLTLVYYILQPEQVGWMFFFQIAINFTAGPTSPLVWSMYADTADYSEWKTGRRATGLVFSAASAAQKFGWTIGGALTGLLLQYVGYQANMNPQDHPDAVEGIRKMISVIPAIGAGLAAVSMIFYSLNDKRMAQIETDLRSRRDSN